MTLDPALEALLKMFEGAPPLESLPIEGARAVMKAGGPDLLAPTDVEARDLQIDGAEGKIGARLYTPPGAPATTPGILYFHGGGFMIGDLDTHDGQCRRMAKAGGLRVLSVDYRLAPEHPLPAGHDDAEAAVRWTFAHAAEIGFDPARIAVAGDSAGGNLAAWVAYVFRDDPKHRIKAQGLLYPATSMAATTESRKALGDGYMLTEASMQYFTRGTLGEKGDPNDLRLNILSAEDVSKVAAAHVVTAGFDPLKDEGKAYAEKLAAAGVPTTHVCYDAFIHGFYTMGNLAPSIAAAVDETAVVIRKMLD